MLCRSLKALPADASRFLMEPKLDGHRYIAGISSKSCWLESRTGNRVVVPYLFDELARYLPADTVLDGELVAPCPRGNPPQYSTATSNDVQRLLGTVGLRSHVLCYVAFDLLVLDGEDIRGWALEQRRELLEAIAAENFEPAEHVAISLASPASEELHQKCLAVGLEGTVIKDLDSKYRPGSRSGGWYKLKPQDTADVVIVGLPHDGQGKYAGKVGAIEFGLFDEKGTLIPIGRCSGMTDPERDDMTAHPNEWIGECIEIAHHGWMKDGFRSAQYKRVRTDKLPRECTLDAAGVDKSAALAIQRPRLAAKPAASGREPNEGLRRHKLMPKEIRATLPPLGAQDELGEDAIAYLRLFCPAGAGTWLFTEFDGEDTLFGFGGPFGLEQGEWGYSSLREMAEVTTDLGMGGVRIPAIERDCAFEPATVGELLAGGDVTLQHLAGHGRLSGPMAVAVDPEPEQAAARAQATVERDRTASTVTASGASKRNYAAMGEAKLLDCLEDLRAGEGPAVEKALSAGATLDAELAKAEAAAAAKGLI